MNGKIVLSVLTAFIITFLSFFIFYDIFNESAKAFSEHQFFTQEFNTKIKKIFIFGSSHVGQLNTPYINEIISGPYEDYIAYNTASAADDPRERLENLHLLISLKPEIVFYGISYRDFHTPLLEDEFSFDIKQLSKEIISDDNPILKINPKFTTLQLIRNSFSDTSLFSKDRFYPENTPFYYVTTELTKTVDDRTLEKLLINSKIQIHIDDPNYNESLAHLKEIINELQEGNIKIVFFQTPLHRIYLNEITDTEKIAFNSILDTISREFDVKIYDFSDKYADLPIWSNLTHIAYNEKSVIFSEDIAKMIISEIES